MRGKQTGVSVGCLESVRLYVLDERMRLFEKSVGNQEVTDVAWVSERARVQMGKARRMK